MLSGMICSPAPLLLVSCICEYLPLFSSLHFCSVFFIPVEQACLHLYTPYQLSYHLSLRSSSSCPFLTTAITMIASLSCVLSCVALAAASPVVWPRTVSSLNEPAVAEAQQRDNTATRAFSNVEITVCLQLTPSWGQLPFYESL